MLLDKGVQEIGDPTQCHAVAIDARAPKFDGGIITRHDSVVFGIVVNKHAQRFYDEGEDIWPKRYAIWGRLVAAQPDQIAYIIFDSSVVTSFMPTLFPPIAGQTIAELAGKLELDPAALEKTIADFNAAVRPGTFDHTILDDCRTEGVTPPKTHWARKIEAPPYLAYPVRPGITFTYLGTRVNKQSRMLMKDGKPSANMFAAGEIMAGNVLGKGYAAGIGMTIGSVFGRVAGREAAKNAQELTVATIGEEPCHALRSFPPRPLLMASHTGRCRRADRAARHGLVPCRRPAGRNQRQAGQGGDLHAGRRAGQGRPERHLSGRADVCAVLSARQREGRLSAA